MEFRIDAETYLRLAQVALQPSERHPKLDTVLRSVRIEHLKGNRIALASNGAVLIGEWIGECDPNEIGGVNVTIDPVLQGMATIEANQHGGLIITQAPGWTVARGVHGAMYPLNAEIAGEFPAWRGLIPLEQPTKPNGTMAFLTESVYRMIEAAPSNVIVFPEIIDFTVPVIVRDKTDPNWFALYMPSEHYRQDWKPATVPDFLR